LHTRVFINSRGLPTYEAKELGLNQKKFELYPLDLSIIITGNEIVEYFKVLLKVMELIMPAVAQKTRHIGHGMLRLASGKMSSRTGEVITAEVLIDQAKAKIKEKENPARLSDGQAGDLPEAERENTTEQIAIGAIKYSILKQSPGRDIIFDFDKSLAIEGNSGPYLQYTYARLNSILNKAGNYPDQKMATGELKEKSELNLIKQILEFPETVENCGANIAPQHLALYLYQLANLANNFYEAVPVLKDENPARLYARLALVKTTAAILKQGLTLLGIKALPKI